MRRQGRGFPRAVSSIVSSHHPASRVRVSLTLTDNWKRCIVFPSAPVFVPHYYCHAVEMVEQAYFSNLDYSRFARCILALCHWSPPCSGRAESLNSLAWSLLYTIE